MREIMSRLEIGSIWQSKTSPRLIVQIVSGVHSQVYFPGWYKRREDQSLVFIPKDDKPECKRASDRLYITYRTLMSSYPKEVGKFSSGFAHSFTYNMKEIGHTDLTLTGEPLYPDLQKIHIIGSKGAENIIL